MTPSADQANAADAQTLLPTELLDDGEVVILAIKPSGWFVLLASWPVLVIAALAGAAMGLLRAAGPYQAALLLCAAAVCLRIMVACFQWMGLLYVLTNRRVMRIHGLARASVVSCPLADISQVEIAASRLEGPLGLGSLYFQTNEGPAPDASWTNIARPEQAHQAISEAIRRAG